ncbi:MAG: TlpA family protein disulfide reductase [Streptosporangiaceae bacterium]
MFCPPRPARAAARVLAGRGVLAAMLAAGTALAVAGCAGGAIGASTVASNGKSFVSGAGLTVYRPGSRPVAPDVRGTTLTGQKLRLASYRGHVLVLNFWGSWCTPCREEAPALATLAQRLGPAGVRFLGVDVNDNVASALAFMHTFNISYPSLNDPGDMIALDFSGTVPLNATPSTLVIDRSGRVAARILGGVTYDVLKPIITQVAAERS